MRAFICEINHHGLRRIVPEELVPADALARYTRTRFAWATSLVWALLDDGDAETLRGEVLSRRHGDACNLLLNRAVGLVGLGSIVPSAPVGPRAATGPGIREQRSQKQRTWSDDPV